MQVLKQLSVFLENKPGVLARLCEEFAGKGINLQGITVSDTVDHAVIRLIPGNPSQALAVLESAGQLVVETDVLALPLANRPGELADVAKRLAKAKVNIEYAYGTVQDSSALLILRVNDIRKAQKALKAK
ncbi:MAG: ACT domain-containing protein [Planctomycetota bacterium]